MPDGAGRAGGQPPGRGGAGRSAGAPSWPSALNARATVTLFCGAGVRRRARGGDGAGRRAAAPVGHSLRGKEWIQYDNPYDVGMSGLLGYGACYEAMPRGRPAGAARHRLPLRQLPAEAQHRPGRPRPRAAGPPHPAGAGGARRRRRDAPGGAAAGRAEDRPPFLDRMLRRAREGAGARGRRLHPATSSDTCRSTPSTSRAASGRARRRRRGVHRGHRHVQRVGRPLPHAPTAAGG